MLLFSLLPYKFGWADVELFFKMFGEYLGGVIPQGICNFRNLHLAFCQELLCPFHADGSDELDGFPLQSEKKIVEIHQPDGKNDLFVTGVGAETMKAAYGVNRADWSYIPGGVSPGTNLIRPDLPELLHFPFLWQEGEYCLGGHATWFMYMVLASNKILNCNE